MKEIVNFIKKNIAIIILVFIVLLFFVVMLGKESMKKKTTYTVVEGTIDYSDETNLYLLKKENIVDYDKSLAVTSIVEQGKRASRGEAIATYQSDSYEEYLKQIDEIDKQIQTLVKDMPPIYSADITSLDDKILKNAKEIQLTTSYIKMQEYKSKLDELAYKKITVLANASPDNSAIRDLIAQRDALTQATKQSSNVITTPIAGIVSYKVDGLESSYDFNNIENLDASALNNLVSSFDNNTNGEFGIKVVDNFKAYLLVKTAKGDNDQYITEGRNYTIKITDLDNTSIRANLVKSISDENYNYSLFSITNGIDDYADYRKLSCVVIWKEYTAMAVPRNSIYQDEATGMNYVRMVYGAEYVSVPVKITNQSDSIALVENVDKETAEKNGFDTTFKLELYDELVIE